MDCSGVTGRGIEPVLLRPGDDLRELAEDAVRRGADVLGMAGGDGSQALVASVAARAGLGYVCVPAGTRNHFALDLGLDRADVVGALDAYADGLETFGYRNSPLESMAYDAQASFSRSTQGFDAEKLVAEKLSEK